MKLIVAVFIILWISFFARTSPGQRGDLLLKHVADHYRPPSEKIEDPEKYWYPKAIARFAVYGHNDSAGNAIVKRFAGHNPFHFTMIGLTRLMCQYQRAPAMAEAEHALLQKVFSRNDSYNALNGEGTENHLNMARTSGYLFAQKALKYPDLQPTAKNWITKLKKWIEHQSSKILECGTGEWNSSIYGVYNVIGWANLYDFAEDEEVKSLAKKVLDFYASEFALNYYKGMVAGPEMRGGSVTESFSSGTCYWSWVWYGDVPEEHTVFKGSQYIQSVHAALCSYVPGEAGQAMAHKQIPLPHSARLTRPSYLYENCEAVSLTYYIDSTYHLASARVPYTGFTAGTSQVVPWKCAMLHKGTAKVITGNGRFYTGTNGRFKDPFTQIAQYDNVLIQATCIPKNVEEILTEKMQKVGDWIVRYEADLKKRFPVEQNKNNVVSMNAGSFLGKNASYISFPAEMELYYSEKNSILMKLENTYVKVIPLGELQPVQDFKTGIKTLEVTAEPGTYCGFVLAFYSGSSWDTLSAFEKQLQRNPLNIKTGDFAAKGILHLKTGTGEIIHKPESETFNIEPILDWGFGPNKPAVIIQSPPFMQPEW